MSVKDVGKVGNTCLTLIRDACSRRACTRFSGAYIHSKLSVIRHTPTTLSIIMSMNSRAR